MKNWKLMAAACAMATAVFTMQAWAHGPHGPGGRPGRFGGGVLHFGGLIEQLIFPCRSACTEAEHTCREDAESAALSCATQTCAATIDSAQTDCAADRSSEACLTDVSALITCIQPCLVTQGTALTACAATFRTCVAACSPTPTPAP